MPSAGRQEIKTELVLIIIILYKQTYNIAIAGDEFTNNKCYEEKHVVG